MPVVALETWTPESFRFILASTSRASLALFSAANNRELASESIPITFLAPHKIADNDSAPTPHPRSKRLRLNKSGPNRKNFSIIEKGVVYCSSPALFFACLTDSVEKRSRYDEKGNPGISLADRVGFGGKGDPGFLIWQQAPFFLCLASS